MRQIDIKILPELANNKHFEATSELIKYRQSGPCYATTGAAAMDIRACIDRPIRLSTRDCVIIPTGFAMDIDDKEVAAVLLPRSGIGSKEGIVLGNLVGLIDSDYHGGVGVALWNRNHDAYNDSDFYIKPGDRICQMMFVPVIRVEFNPVDCFASDTLRGTGGFGHTGVE